MIESLPQIWDFFSWIINQYWGLLTTCSILAGFFALAVLDKMFHIFDILRK